MSSFQNDQKNDLDKARGRRDSAFDSAMGGLKSQSETGGFDPDRLNTIRGNADNLAKTGGYDMDQVAGLRSRLSSGTGGMDPDVLKGLRERGNAFMDDGGFDMDQLNKVRGGFENFANTGGFSDIDRTNYLNRATSGVGQTYRTLQQQQAQARAKTGGLGSGGGYAQMARQLGQAQADATRDAQVDLNTQINQNKLAGLGGLRTTESDFASGRRSAFDTVTGMEDRVASGNRSNNEQLLRLESDLAGGIRSGAGLQSDIEGKVAEGRNQATQGYMKMFTDNAGQVNDIGAMILKSAGLNYSTQAEAIQALTRLSQNPGAFQTAFNNVLSLMNASKGLIP